MPMATLYTFHRDTFFKTFSRRAIGALLLAATTHWAHGQVATSYGFGQAAGTYTEITGGTQVAAVTSIGSIDLNTIDDNVYGPQTIPGFNFNGTVYTQLYISANGFITFGSAPTGTNYTPLSSAETYARCVAAFGADLVNAANGTGTRDIRIQTVGTEVVVQWRRFRRFNSPALSEVFNLQIRLNTSTGAIRTIYGPITQGPDASTVKQPEVGLRGPNNTFATNVNNRTVGTGTENWATSLPGTGNASKMRFTSSAPAKSWTAGLTYTWTPCTTPAATFTVQNDCGAQQFSVDVTTTSFGGGTSGVLTYSVNNGA